MVLWFFCNSVLVDCGYESVGTAGVGFASKLKHFLYSFAETMEVVINQAWNEQQVKLEQLECLRSENTPCHHMITHTIDSYLIPSQNKTKSKLQIKRICPKFKFWNVAKN